MVYAGNLCWQCPCTAVYSCSQHNVQHQEIKNAARGRKLVFLFFGLLVKTVCLLPVYLSVQLEKLSTR